MNKITCICLGVRSMEKSIKFYRDELGFDTEEKADNPKVVFFNTQGTKFELYLKEPQDVYWGGYHAYFADLDGYYWEVAWGPDFKFDDNGMLMF